LTGSVAPIVPAVLALFLTVTAAGCATTAPTRADLSSVAENPQNYRNQRLELTGKVIDYEPARGDTYRTLLFTLGVGPTKKIPVFASGYTAEAIAKASQLVGEAHTANQPLTVTGKMKIGKTENDPAAAELRLESVEYAGRKVDVKHGQKTRPGFQVGGFVFTPSVGVGATITP
jgi:hypothetical protein